LIILIVCRLTLKIHYNLIPFKFNLRPTLVLFINKSWELSQNFEEDGSVTYFLKKKIYGVGCPNQIYVDMKFDSNKNLISRQIENGVFLED